MNLAADHAKSIFNAAVDSVRARPLVSREVQIDGDELCIAGHRWSRKKFDRVVIVGAGKATAQMAVGLVESLNGWLPHFGWINVPEGTQLPIENVTVHPARPAGINEPTEAGVIGTREILERVASATPRDLCIALISGGGSALLPAPREGITLSDKLDVTRFLSGAGADIVELNTVRKHLSEIKGGGLLRACRAGQLITLVLSDVLGDPLDLIASGPTVPDSSSAQDAIAVLAKYDPNRSLSQSIYQVLESGRSSASPISTPFETIVLGNNAVAVDEAGIRAESLGFNHAMQSASECEGAAEDVGRHLADMTIQMLREDHQVNCLITGGEPTVRLAEASIRGRGGRNQQLVLAAYQHLLNRGLDDQEWQRIALLSGGTDGEDGPTAAAGAVLSADVHRSAAEQRLDVADYLARNDAFTFFEKTGGLLMTGPTGTNVCDVRVVVVNES